MKRIVYIFALILIVCLFATACTNKDTASCNDDNNQAQTNENPDAQGKFTLTGIVLGVTDRIEIEVTNSDYAYGVYWVLVSNNTEIFDAYGNKISLTGIKTGDSVEIVYGGQVMMSYPPQIVAHKVTVK